VPLSDGDSIAIADGPSTENGRMAAIAAEQAHLKARGVYTPPWAGGKKYMDIDGQGSHPSDGRESHNASVMLQAAEEKNRATAVAAAQAAKL
jgi:transcription elongation factor